MRQWGEKNLHLSAEQIGERGPATTIGHVNHVDPGHHLEQLAGNMGPGADASRCHADLARTGFSVGDEFGNGLGRYRRIHHDHTGKADEAREQMLLALVPDPLWWSVGDPHPDSGETSLEL